jgi:hypothetical protein
LVRVVHWCVWRDDRRRAIRYAVVLAAIGDIAPGETRPMPPRPSRKDQNAVAPADDPIAGDWVDHPPQRD